MFKLRLASVSVAVLFVGTGVQADIMDTLQRMQKIAVTLPGVSAAQIDTGARVLVVTVEGGATYTVSPDNLDLTLETLGDEADKVQAVVEFMSKISEAPDLPQSLDSSLQSILPVVTSTELARAPGASDLGIWHSELAPGLSEFLVFDAADSVNYVTQSQIDDSTLGLDEIRDKARQNLRGRAASKLLEEYSASPWVAGLLLDGFYECSLMLLPEIWSDLTKKVGEVAVSCPARGELLIVKSEDGLARATVGAYALDAVKTHPYPASEFLYVWQEAGWRLLP